MQRVETFERGTLAIFRNGEKTVELHHRLNGRTNGGSYRLITRHGKVKVSERGFITETKARIEFEKRMEQ